jgi:hypothetical protein
MADAFFQALCCQPVTVFGRKLKPFSLSHSFILSSLDNGYGRTADGSRSDLLHAVWICGRDHATNTAKLLKPEIGAMIWFGVVAKFYDFKHERAKFLQYLSDYLEIPEHWESGEYAGKGFLAPWQYHFAMNAAENCGPHINAAWDMPVALARCYYDVWAEKQGDTSLVSTRERELARAEGMEL